MNERDKVLRKAVVLAGDWHGNTEWALHVINQLPVLLEDEQSPLILHMGDFGIWVGAGGINYIEKITKALKEVNGELWFIDGNHENHSLLNTYASLSRSHGNTREKVEITSRIKHLPRGFRFSLGKREWKRTFVALGGAVSVDRGFRTPYLDWWPDEVITHEQARRAVEYRHRGAEDAWAMLTHDCPSSAPLPLGPPAKGWLPGDLEKSEQHRELLDSVFWAIQPQLLVHGHYHLRLSQTVEFPNHDCRVLSLHCDGENGNIAVLDLETGMVS